MDSPAYVPTNPVVRATLEEAGWWPGRRVEVGQWEEALRSDGFAIVPPALAWLTELGGLTISPPARDGAAYGSGPLVVEPMWAASGEADRIHEREAILGVQLTPVGEWLGEYILLVAQDGQVFAETTFQLLRIGHDLASALERIVVADTAPEEIR